MHHQILTDDSGRPPHTSQHNGMAAMYALLVMATGIALYFFWLGACLARLWYYRGRFEYAFRVYDIQPEYLRSRLARAEANAQQPQVQTVADIQRWNGRMRMMADEEVEALSDDELKERVREDRRISRLPAFVQDDGGDGTAFPQMEVAVPADEYNARHFPQRAVDYKSLGLHRLGKSEWLAVDDTFHEYRDAWNELLERRHRECYKEGVEAEEACEELLGEVAKFLMEKYPFRFLNTTRRATRCVLDTETDKEYALERPYEHPPLEICARLALADFSIFTKDPFTQQYILQASVTCAPAGWRLSSQVGASVKNLRDTVLSWDKFPDIFEYFDNTPDSQPLKRSSTFIQTNPDRRRLSELLFIQELKDFFPGNVRTLSSEGFIVRKERQTFHRLPKSGAIVVTTKTRVRNLADLERKLLPGLAREIRGWSADVARYKGRDLWQRSVLGYCEGKSTVRDDRSVVDPGEFTEEEESD